MTTYVYLREDNSQIEIEQSMSEDALTECPLTKMRMRRIVSGGAGFQLQGQSWPSKTIKKTDHHKRELAKNPLYTSLPEYKEKAEQVRHDAEEKRSKSKEYFEKIKPKIKVHT